MNVKLLPKPGQRWIHLSKSDSEFGAHHQVVACDYKADEIITFSLLTNIRPGGFSWLGPGRKFLQEFTPVIPEK